MINDKLYYYLETHDDDDDDDDDGQKTKTFNVIMFQ
jgi:hypothetical protein